MNALALILMILVQLAVTAIMVFLLVKAARSGFKSGEEEPQNSES